MATFTDAAGRSWRLELDVLAIKRIRSEADPEFLKDLPATFDRLSGDMVMTCMVIASLCHGQWAAAGVTEQEFYASLVGDCIERATEGLIQAVLDFFPSRRREIMRSVATQNQKLLEALWAAAMKVLENPELDQQKIREIEGVIEQSLTDWRNRYTSQAPLESTPSD